MAKTPLFLQLFSQSPMKPIQHHMAKCSECAAALVPYFSAVLQSDWQLAEERYNNIVSLENEADLLKREIRLNLPRNLFLPVSREDLLELLRVQDSIANYSKDIAGLVLGRKLVFPEPAHSTLQRLLDESITATSLASKAADEMNNLVRSGFSGQNASLVEDILDKLGDVEHQSDMIQVELRQIIFSLESQLKPVDAMFIYRIIELIGDVADSAQTTGNRLMCVIAS